VCGIAAVLTPGGEAGPSVAAAIARRLRHRGPDGSGTVRRGPCLLVHTRLAIIDVAGGDQPLTSEDGACSAVVNGEIYNHLDLRAELEARGHRFATRSDSEVIVHGYEEWGEDLVHRLNGIYAFALWDDRAQRLVAARDDFGVKPLYWWTDGRRVAVASEVGAILDAGLATAAVDPIALEHYLAWHFVPAPRTMFAAISKLAPASLLVADASGVRTRSFREAPGAPLAGTADELAQGFRERFVGAVERQMMSDVGYGVFLSGGLDSAAITAAMLETDDAPPLTFTIGFPGAGGGIDERDPAAETARLLGARHQATAMGEADYRSELRYGIERLEEPCGSQSAPALLQLSRFAARHTKVVLSGQGADEPLGGYRRYHASAALDVLERLPGGIAAPAERLAEALPRNERAKRAARVLAAPPGLERLLTVFEISSPERRAALTGGDGAEAAAERSRIAGDVLADVPDRGALEQTLYLDTHVFLPDGLLVYGDKMSMAWGLEQRVPFLDRELMRFVEQVPAKMRMHRFRRKWLYRKAVAPLVPREVVERRKHAFVTPYDRWLRAEMGTEVERLFTPGSALGEVLQPRAVERLVAEHRSGRADHKRLLFCLLEFGEWHRAFVEGERGTPRWEPAGVTA
jgi:asparagine synthase (glutamine-hydrolysing)